MTAAAADDSTTPSLYLCSKSRLDEELGQLARTPGYCVLIDMVGSVALKQKGRAVWCAATCNIIDKSKGWLSGLDPREEASRDGALLLQQRGLLPLKVVGDCIMFYIPERTMPEHSSALTIFSALRSIIREPVYPGAEVRMAAAFCEDAYSISFVEGTNYVHGKDRDLTFRLLEKTGPQELLMNQPFYEKAWCLATEDWREFNEIDGPAPQNFKGFEEPIDICRWRGPRFAP